MRHSFLAFAFPILFFLPVNLFSQPYQGQKGDVNNDGTVSVLDVVRTVRFILGSGVLGEEEEWRADCNSFGVDCRGNGEADILDVTKIVNLILQVVQCSNTTVTDIDGNVYYTVRIGAQEWMAENLKVTHYRNGDAMLNVTDDGQWPGLRTGAYCNYDNNASDKDIYGRLYNWYAVNDSRKIAPTGWHVPTDEEWKELEKYLGMSQSEADDTGWRGTNEGSKLAGNASLWPSGDLKKNAEFGTSGFSALPGGFRVFYGTFYDLGDKADFWSVTKYYSLSAWGRHMKYQSAQVYRGYYPSRP